MQESRECMSKDRSRCDISFGPKCPLAGRARPRRLAHVSDGTAKTSRRPPEPYPKCLVLTCVSKSISSVLEEQPRRSAITSSCHRPKNIDRPSQREGHVQSLENAIGRIRLFKLLPLDRPLAEGRKAVHVLCRKLTSQRCDL